MSRTQDSVIPRSKLTAHMPPGAGTPRSGTYEQSGRRDVPAAALPATDGRGLGWTLVVPGKGKKKA